MFPVAVIDYVTQVHDQTQRRAAAGVSAATHLYVLDAQGRLWMGPVQSAGKNSLGGLGFPVDLPGGQNGAAPREARLSYGGKAPILHAVIGRVMFGRVKDPAATQKYGIQERAPGEFAISMNNPVAAEAEESFCLFVPTRAEIKESSTPWTSKQSLGDYTCIIWTGRRHKNSPRYVVNVVVKLKQPTAKRNRAAHICHGALRAFNPCKRRLGLCLRRRALMTFAWAFTNRLCLLNRF